MNRMGASAIPAIQRAMYVAMLADTELVGMLNFDPNTNEPIPPRIYDDVPQDEVFPYVNFGSATSIPYRTHTRSGEEVTMTLSVWSLYDGYKEIEQIHSRLNALFGDAPLTVEGYDTIRCFFDYATMLRQRNNVRHGPIRYRVIVQPQLS